MERWFDALEFWAPLGSLGLGLMGCSAPGEDAPATQPEDWAADVALAVVEELDPDPNVLEVEIEARLATLEIRPGVQTEVWTYNGSVPGPLLRAQRGDRLIVHFTNHLPEATTIHWHGLRVPADMDGTHAVQNPVEPGESFTYDFVLPDAGTFWYHPHLNSSAQVGYGLYGPLIVDDPDDPLDIDDVVLVFSDMSLDDEGKLLPGDSDEWFGDYFGREGSTLLVNGRVRPQLKARTGVPQRWRIINAARARYLKLEVPGSDLVRVGGDAGLLEHPQELEFLHLAASERAEVVVRLPQGAPSFLDVPYKDPDRFRVGFTQPDQPLLGLEVSAGPSSRLSLPKTLRRFPPLELSGAKIRHITLGEKVVDGLAHLAINGEVHEGDHHHASDTSHVAYVGDTEIWEVHNETGYDHPFHLHGFTFEVLELGGQPWPVRELKDSVNVPGGEMLRFLVTYDDRPGLWMFHCHILDHAQLGMMAVLDVRPAE